MTFRLDAGGAQRWYSHARLGGVQGCAQQHVETGVRGGGNGDQQQSSGSNIGTKGVEGVSATVGDRAFRETGHARERLEETNYGIGDWSAGRGGSSGGRRGDGAAEGARKGARC